MDFSKMKKSEQLIGLGAVVAVIAAFLPWYSFKWDLGVWGGSSSTSVNGLNSWWMLSFIAAVLALLMVALPMFGVKLPKLGVENNVVYIVLGAVTGGIPVLAMLQGGTSGFGSVVSASFGLFGAIAGGALILIGGFMEKGGSTPSAPTPPPAA